MSNISRLTEKLTDSALTPEQKGLWSVVLSTMTDSDAEATLYLIDNTPNDLFTLTRNIEEKLAALRSGNRAAWEKIIDNDKASLVRN